MSAGLLRQSFYLSRLLLSRSMIGMARIGFLPSRCLLWLAVKISPVQPIEHDPYSEPWYG